MAEPTTLPIMISRIGTPMDIQSSVDDIGYSTSTAVPYARISEAPWATEDVVNRTLMTAFAPCSSAWATIRLVASARLS